jgi:uncharacterized protein YbjT (DUF2867 family)
LYLVIGGAGRTGRRVVDLLSSTGHDVVVASRRSGPTRIDLAKRIDPIMLNGVDGVVVSVEPPMDAVGADTVLNRGVANLAQTAAKTGAQVILISQIYVTRAAEHPEMAGIIRARAAGEQTLRESGAPYTILRPSWLTDGQATGVRLEQGDTGDGQVSRDTVAQAAVAALVTPSARGKTCELYDDPAAGAPDWAAAFASLTADS